MTNAEKFYKEHFVVDMDYELSEESMATVNALEEYGVAKDAEIDRLNKLLNDGFEDAYQAGFNAGAYDQSRKD